MSQNTMVLRIDRNAPEASGVFLAHNTGNGLIYFLEPLFTLADYEALAEDARQVAWDKAVAERIDHPIGRGLVARADRPGCIFYLDLGAADFIEPFNGVDYEEQALIELAVANFPEWRQAATKEDA